MNNKKSHLEVILQNAIDELFALQTQAKEDQRKFIKDSAILIKASYEQVNDCTQAATRAEKAAHESHLVARQTSGIARDTQGNLSFWRRAAFWLGVGYLAVGVTLGCLYFQLGKQITLRKNELAILQLQYDALETAFKNRTKPRIKVKAVGNNQGDVDNVDNFDGNN